MVVRKIELAKKLASKHNITVEKALTMVDDFIGIIKDEVKSGNDVTIRKFGTFKLHEYKSRIGNNFATGGRIHIPAKKAVKFKASEKF